MTDLSAAISEVHGIGMRVAKLAEAQNGEWLCILTPRTRRIWHVGGGSDAAMAVRDALFSFHRKGGRRPPVPPAADDHRTLLISILNDI